MATEIKSKPGLINYYKARTTEVQWYFEHVPVLVDQFPMDVCLAYAFARLELGQNMALYCGAVKIHRADAELARNAVSTHHMTRKAFACLYKTIFGFVLPKVAYDDLKTAEDVRDVVMHGKPTTDDRIRNAIARVLDYTEAVNAQLNAEHGLKPFGKLQGFSGAVQKLDKSTTAFLLKGMGFALS